MPSADYLRAMLIGYVLTVVVETAVLLALLSRRHPVRVRVFAGVWLTACTYPVVWLVLPPLFGADQWALFLLVAETFAPVAECAIFWLAFVRGRPAASANEGDAGLPPEVTAGRWATARDLAAVVLANLCSFGTGEAIRALGWEGLLLGRW